MTPLKDALERWNGACAKAIDGLSVKPWRACLALVALTLATYLPGVVRLPAVDRTEVVYASASRDMLAQGNFHDPRYRDKQLTGKPIGVFWLQMAATAGIASAGGGDITAYRLPSLVGVIVAVLATFWLLAPVLGTCGALVAAALLAVTPLLAVEANLAVADGVTLGAAVVAQLALLRVYLTANADSSPSPRLREEGRGEGQPLAPRLEPAPHPRIKSGASSNPLPVRTGRGNSPRGSRNAVPSTLLERFRSALTTFRAGRETLRRRLRPVRSLIGPAPHASELSTGTLALLFWIAQGIGILLNALAVPLLSLATLAALVAFERRARWFKSLRPVVGVPIMLLIGAPWLITRAIADGGVPFQGLTWSELLAALGGSQNDNWKAAPGSFTLAFALGFLPGAALLIPALWRLWLERGEALGRFLLAWIVGGLIYLELISGKPAIYSVPPLFPAAAAAVVLAMTAGQPRTHPLTIPPRAIAPWWWVPAAFILAVFGSLLWLTKTAPSISIVLGALPVVAALALAGETARRKLAAAWVVTSVGGFALFLTFTFGFFLPHLETAWPSRGIVEATAPLKACAPGPIGIVGFREPSTTFAPGRDTVLLKPKDLAAWTASGEPRVVLVEARWKKDVGLLPERIGCIEAFNVMRGCSLSFSIYLTGERGENAPKCQPPVAYRCAVGAAPARESAETTARCR